MTPQEIKDQFHREKAERLELPPSREIKEAAREYMDEAVREKQFYNGTWMGLPIIQFPDDLMALQEIIWSTKPDIIIETGMAHGGSAAFYGAMLALVKTQRKHVVSIEKGPLPGVAERVRALINPFEATHTLIEGSSTDPDTIGKLNPNQDLSVMVCLDSAHDAEHVRKEIELLGPLVTPGCYLVVFDGFVQFRDPALYQGARAYPGNSPWDAVSGGIPGFKRDTDIERRYLISSNPNGYFVKE